MTEVNSSSKKSDWQPMLDYLAELHERSTFSAEKPLPYDFETLGTGYVGGKCFAHWDTVHVIFDALALGRTEHAMKQLLNLFSLQQSDGFMPGLVYLGDNIFWHADSGWPPVWPEAVDAYVAATGDVGFIKQAFSVLIRQIEWFELNRSASPSGFFYRDILDHNWESGVDEGVRFDEIQTGARTCVDATAHVWALYDAAGRWGEQLGMPVEVYRNKRDLLGEFIGNRLFDEDTGFFYDIWMIDGEARKVGAFEGIWPLVVGVADGTQANRVIDEHLLNNQRFLAPHPISTVALEDPAFEPRMWRGPAWNSMTYWTARGCLRYDRSDAARRLLEAALDNTAKHFARTGTVWEFYDPMGGPPEELQRKPDTPNKIPCSDYTGHNPLHAMKELWEKA